MKVIVLVKATKDSEAGVMPSEQLLTEMGRFNEGLVKAGIMLSGEGLHPSSKGARVQFSGTKRTVVDGPFAETKELVAGFWIWQVKSMQEAIEWVKKCPNPMLVDSEIEIRPVFEPCDFGDALTPELKENESRLRAQNLGLDAPRFENKPELVIAGLNETYTFETRVKIPEQWMRFAKHLDKIPGQVGKSTYGVCWNYKPGTGFDYLTGVEVTDTRSLPAGFTHLTLEPQRYAVFSHREHVSSIPKTIETIWTKWLPDASLKAAEAPCFERYTEEFNPQTGTGGIEIWVPIKA
jgi:predicted transcriptional regulator YdeE